MAKIRKNQSGSAWYVGTALKVLVLCMAITGAAVGYVWQKGQIVRLGQQIHLREVALSQLTHNNQRMAEQIAVLNSPVKLEERAKAMNLGLDRSTPDQVVRLNEPIYPRPAFKTDTRLVAQRFDVQ
jgi:uncharacterized protein HemX